MEKKELAVGEIFQFELWMYKVVEGNDCNKCDLRGSCCNSLELEVEAGSCLASTRKDGKDVIFVEVDG